MGIDYPSVWQMLAAISEKADLALCNAASGEIHQDGICFSGRGESDRVRSQTSLAPAERGHAMAFFPCAGHGKAEAILLRGAQCIISQHPHMPGSAQYNRAHAVLAGLLDGVVGGAQGAYLSQVPLPVPDCRGGRIFLCPPIALPGR